MSGLEQSTGLLESGYKPINYKGGRKSAAGRTNIQWKKYSIGQRAIMIAHVCIENKVGPRVAEVERKFGYDYCEAALTICLANIEGFRDWYLEQSKGEDPEAWDGKRNMRRGAYRLYQRIWNSVYNMNGRKEDGSRAARSNEHYMHPSQITLRQWEVWARKTVQQRNRFKVQSISPSRSEHTRVPKPLKPKPLKSAAVMPLSLKAKRQLEELEHLEQLGLW